MAGLNEIIRERKNLLRLFKAKARMVEDAAQGMLRYLDRIIKRSKSVPTVEDYNRVMEEFKKMDGITNEFLQTLEDAGGVFYR